MIARLDNAYAVRRPCRTVDRPKTPCNKRPDSSSRSTGIRQAPTRSTRPQTWPRPATTKANCQTTRASDRPRSPANRTATDMGRSDSCCLGKRPKWSRPKRCSGQGMSREDAATTSRAAKCSRSGFHAKEHQWRTWLKPKTVYKLFFGG